MEPAAKPKQKRRKSGSHMGIVVAILVVTTDGVEICDETPGALREGDFVHIYRNRAVFAEHIDNDGMFDVAEALIKRQGEFHAWFKREKEKVV